MAGALDGFRVIDFGQYIAGPMAAMLLADQGADVIRVDPPGGPRWNTPANATWNRNKRSVVLDLKTDEGRSTARGLIRTADVVIENFRPGVMNRLGLGAEAMTSANPALVYCSLPGFASDDPRNTSAAWEGVVGAATGTYRSRSSTGQPVFTAIPISSTYAAFVGAVAIGMALNARERDGVGQIVEVPLFDATFSAIGLNGLRVHDPKAAPARSGAMLTWTRQFRCKDGRWFMYHAGNQNTRPFFEAAGAAGWLDANPDATQAEVTKRAEKLFRTKTAAEWEALCEKVGTEGAECRSSDEWLDNPHALKSKIIVDGTDPILGLFRGPGINVRMSKTPGRIRSARRLPDADRKSVLADVAKRAAPPPSPVDGALRAALDGVKVVDLCIILAGPTAGRTLAEYGADVVRIDSPHRDGVIFHNDINRGKRSLVMDLKRPEGLELLWQLVEGADVVVQNFRKGVADRLGIGYEAVRARRPDIVYASLNTYGQVGPYAGRPGHEQIAQAASGMQKRYGGSARPVLAPFPVNDYGTGFMGAFGIALALLHRKRTGEGQHVDSALAYTATMLQSSLLQRYKGKKWNEPRGQESLGSGPLNRAYRAADGWLFLAARPEDLDRCKETRGLAGLEAGLLQIALEERLKQSKVATWVKRFTAAGAGAHRIVDDVAEIMNDPWVQAHGLSLTREHDGFGLVTTNGVSARLSRTQPLPGRPAPRPGSDAAGILSDVGRASDLDRLVRDAVVVLEGVPAR